MRKPLLALGLVVSTSFGAPPVANTLAATPTGSTLSSSIPLDTLSQQSPRSVSGAQIVATAMRYLGYRYTATGNSPSTGFSCIGFASFVYRSNGIPLPGDLGSALAYAPRVPFSALAPGDLVYFQNTVWTGLSHVAIYIGGGKMIHAAWYNTGVIISSLSEPYWSTRYLAANRPWTGPAGAAVVNPPSTKAPTTAPGTTAKVVAPKAPAALVSVYSLNVRATPSTKATVVTVITKGTTVYILGHIGSWYRVELTNGTIGWVIGKGIGRGGNVGTVTAPSDVASNRSTVHTTVSVSVDGLRVHSSPSLGAPVVSSVSRNQHLVVLARSGGWIKVRLPNGTVGWISAAYLSGSAARTTTASTSKSVTKAKTRTVKTKTTRAVFGKTASVAMNVRSGPSMSNAIVTVIPPGASYRVLNWSNGWAHVQLPNGTVGWISSVALGSSAASKSRSRSSTIGKSRTRASSSSGAVLTAGVRVHSGASTKAAVLGLAAAGTHVRVLGYTGGWDRVRLPSGMTGYVLGIYVKA